MNARTTAIKRKDESLGVTSDGTHVLIVDDSEENRALLERHLRKFGHRTSLAENGRQAVELLESQPFDLVLLDIMMPVMNGFEVLEYIKSDTSLQHVPVIVISASDEEESAVQCIRMGAEDFLPKPFKRVLLQARVDASLRKKRSRDQELMYRRELDDAKRRADELLHALFPHPVVQELKMNRRFRPRRYENVAVLFCDIVNFTPYCDAHDPEEVVSHLQTLVEEFEVIAKDCELEKIKTIGDAFMAATNILTPVDEPVFKCVRCGLEMIESAKRLPPHWEVRIGIHTGPVVAGVVGTQKYAFDIWGDTVNMAARIEGTGEQGCINISAAAWQQIMHRCRGISKQVDVKGKGMMDVIVLKGLTEDV